MALSSCSRPLQPGLLWVCAQRTGRWQPQRVLTSDVPLAQLPPALGVDRALAAWAAWQQQRQPVLVADAGTALSLTLVDAAGCFQGGG